MPGKGHSEKKRKQPESSEPASTPAKVASKSKAKAKAKAKQLASKATGAEPAIVGTTKATTKDHDVSDLPKAKKAKLEVESEMDDSLQLPATKVTIHTVTELMDDAQDKPRIFLIWKDALINLINGNEYESIVFRLKSGVLAQHVRGVATQANEDDYIGGVDTDAVREWIIQAAGETHDFSYCDLEPTEEKDGDADARDRAVRESDSVVIPDDPIDTNGRGPLRTGGPGLLDAWKWGLGESCRLGLGLWWLKAIAQREEPPAATPAFVVDLVGSIGENAKVYQGKWWLTDIVPASKAAEDAVTRMINMIVDRW